MSNLLDKFKTLCTKNIKLPDSGEITATQLNVQFQNKLYDIIRKGSIDNCFLISSE